MGIREERETQAARFVNMRDLIEGLAEMESLSIDVVADYILKKFESNAPPGFIRQDPKSLVINSVCQELCEELLRYASSYGVCGDSREYDPDPAEYYEHGWLRGEITEFLKGISLEAPPCCSINWNPPPVNPSPSFDLTEVQRLRDELASVRAESEYLKVELERLTAAKGKALCEVTNASSAVTLPHITRSLRAVIDIMWENWDAYDPKRLPKQIAIAREIDAALDWGGRGDVAKEPSRSAKAIAKIIKPDELSDTE